MARWEVGDGGKRWVLSDGAGTPPLVLRGVIRPVGGWRDNANAWEIDVEGAPRKLSVAAQSHGPLGLIVTPMMGRPPGGPDFSEAEALDKVPPGVWARTNIDVSTESPATVEVVSPDIPGQRRGQTAPYVVVLSGDATTPSEQPDERTPLGADDVTVRWELAPARCTSCMVAYCAKVTGIDLGGALARRISWTHDLRGQLYCNPFGVGISCGGPSGGGDLSLKLLADGTLVVMDSWSSDGACSPGEDCVSRKELARFRLGRPRPGLRLVPDPSGTLPPPFSCPGDMTAIPCGTYSPLDRDDAVTLGAYCLDKTEVAVDAYAACVNAGHCSGPDAYDARPGQSKVFCNWKNAGRGTHPINCVDWNQARSYCAFAGKRLPTEEEWEWAARNGDGDRGATYPWGEAEPDARLLNAYGAEGPPNAKSKGFSTLDWKPVMYSGSDGFPETAPVGSFPAGDNRWGVRDLAGNVWEWTATNRDAQTRAVRGGGWTDHDALRVRAAFGNGAEPSLRAYDLGFRCAR